MGKQLPLKLGNAQARQMHCGIMAVSPLSSHATMHAIPAEPLHLQSLAHTLAAHASLPPMALLHVLIQQGLDRPALPGAGATLQRWRALAMVGAHDLSLAKFYEGHTDAVAILAELNGPAPAPGSAWGVWCAEPPEARLQLLRDADGACYLHGAKAWCSGAHNLTHALVSCWTSAGQACLAAVDLRQPQVAVSADGWAAVGMRDSASVDVHFDRAPAQALGEPGDYVDRPGFWHGGAGVAACWYGAASTLAARLWDACAQADAAAQAAPDAALRLAQLGEIDVALSTCAALLRQCAQQFDRQPGAKAMDDALRVRLAVEAAATAVLALATRALGAGPLCKDGRLARMVADLPVFLRQSHGQRDLAALGRRISCQERAPWSL